MTKDYIESLVKGKTIEEILLLGRSYSDTFSIIMDQNDTKDYLRVGFHVLGIPMYNLPSPLKSERRGCDIYRYTDLWKGEVILWVGGNYYLSVFEKNLDKE